MKNNRIVKPSLILLLLLFGSSQMVSANASSAWLHDLQSAMKESAHQRKPLFIHFYTPYCGYCKKMRESTFPDREVQQELRHYILVMVDVAADKETGARYEVRGVPDNRIYGIGGHPMLMKIPGFMEAKPFALELKKTREYFENSRRRIQAYAQTKDTQKKIELALEIGKDFYNIEDYDNAAAYFQKSSILNSFYPKDPLYHKFYGFSLMATGQYKPSIAQFEKFLSVQNPPLGEEQWNVRFLLAYSQMQAGKQKEALDNFALVKKHSSSEAIKKDAAYLHSKLSYLLTRKKLQDKELPK